MEKGWYKGSEKAGPEIEKVGEGKNNIGGSPDRRSVDASMLEGC